MTGATGPSIPTSATAGATLSSNDSSTDTSRAPNGLSSAVSVPASPPVLDYAAPSRSSPFWLRLLTWTACAIVLYFVAIALIRQFRQVQWSQVHFRPIPAAAGIVCVLGVSAMQLLARWTLLIAYGYPLTWRVQLPAAWVPQLGKYVPGGVASVGGAVYLLRRHGVPGAVGLSVAVLLDALAVMAGLIVSAPLLFSPAVRQRLPGAGVAGAAMIVAGLILLHPRVFVALLNLALRLARRQPIAQVPPLSKYLWPVLASFGQWLFAGLGVWFMTMTVTTVSPRQIPLFIASAALAMTVSYLTPFAPGGIGIREGVYVLTLRAAVGPDIAIVALAMRVIQTMAEVVLAGVGAWVMRGERARTTR